LKGREVALVLIDALVFYLLVLLFVPFRLSFDGHPSEKKRHLDLPQLHNFSHASPRQMASTAHIATFAPSSRHLKQST